MPKLKNDYAVHVQPKWLTESGMDRDFDYLVVFDTLFQWPRGVFGKPEAIDNRLEARELKEQSVWYRQGTPETPKPCATRAFKTKHYYVGRRRLSFGYAYASCETEHAVNAGMLNIDDAPINHAVYSETSVTVCTPTFITILLD